MVARLLHACGLSLGPAGELMGPTPDNPEGYWENVRFVKVNDRILAQFGGWWSNPPSFPARWEFSPALGPLFAEAEELVRGFSGQASWGWKDPRNSLTVAFWRRLVPDLKVVVCVRNPLEVDHSLLARGDLKSESQLPLWLTYYRWLLSAVPPTHRIVTHYQSYFQDPRAELRRVLDGLRLHAPDEVVEQACAHVSSRLRHYQLTAAGLLAAGVPDQALRLYLSLCAEAGPVYRQVRERERESELRRAAAPETSPGSPRPAQIERLHSLEGELAELQDVGAPRARGSGPPFLRPLKRALDALRAAKARLWSR